MDTDKLVGAALGLAAVGLVVGVASKVTGAIDGSLKVAKEKTKKTKEKSFW